MLTLLVAYSSWDSTLASPLYVHSWDSSMWVNWSDLSFIDGLVDGSKDGNVDGSVDRLQDGNGDGLVEVSGWFQGWQC